jgi:hypothetical protein
MLSPKNGEGQIKKAGGNQANRPESKIQTAAKIFFKPLYLSKPLKASKSSVLILLPFLQLFQQGAHVFGQGRCKGKGFTLHTR